MFASRKTAAAAASPAFPAETMRALASALLLLGLIGDRRVR